MFFTFEEWATPGAARYVASLDAAEQEAISVMLNLEGDIRRSRA